MRDITVILTCCGGLVSPGQIESLRAVTERKIRIIGTDMRASALGAFMVDKFYVVPAGDDPTFIESIINIAQKEGVDVILPTSNEESLSLSQHKRYFEDKGINVATSDYDSLRVAYDKGLCYQFLKDKGLPSPRFYIVETLGGFTSSAVKLGYPSKPVVMKPLMGRGGRGVRILTDSKNSFLKDKTGSLETNFSFVSDALVQGGFAPFLLMEYLPGDEYSVDLLVKDGQPLITVPKLRLDTTSGVSMVGIVKKNPEVEKLVADICRAFKFNYNINIQLKYSYDNKPIPTDLNPRVGGTITLATAAGANLLYYGVKMALGEEIPKVEIKDGVKMIRYLKEYYV